MTDGWQTSTMTGGFVPAMERGAWLDLARSNSQGASKKAGILSIPVTQKQLVMVLGTSAIYTLGELLTGTSVMVAALFGVAILFGMLAIFAGGGLKSAFGCLNAILIGKFLLFGLALKIFLLEPADGTLKAPETTAWVMALGFLGLFLGTHIQSRFSVTKYLLLDGPKDDEMLLSFSVALFALSYFAYFAVMISSAQDDSIHTGGWLGIARAVASLKSFAIVPPMLLLWRRQTCLWMTHPLILSVLGWSAVVGIFSTSKEDSIAPLAFYLLVGFMRYGLRDIRLWSLVMAGVLYYAVIVFPYSQYVRHNGGRQGSMQERGRAIKETFWRILTDPRFRSSTSESESTASYFEQPGLSPFSRMAMVGEADKLIFATQHQQAFTGWETITWGFKLLTPSFFYPDKPVFEAGNYLGHIVGEVADSDTTTQVSYGIMANLYNAFSFPGVFVGTVIFFAGFYYWIRIFLGDARWDGLPMMSALCFIWLVSSFQHNIVESSLSGVIASLSFPVVLIIVWTFSKWLVMFLPKKMVRA